MIDAVQDSYTFVVLFRGQEGLAAQEMLRSATNPESLRSVYVQLPEVRGLEFFSAVGPVAAGLNAWWGRTVPPSSRPVFLTMDEAGLDPWIQGTEGCWFVGVADPERERLYSAMPEPVFPVVTRDAEVVTEQAMQAIGGRGEVDPVFHPSFPYRQAAVRWMRAVPRLDARNASMDPPIGVSTGPEGEVDRPTVPGPVARGAGPLEPPGAASGVRRPPRAPERPISYEPEPEPMAPPGPPVSPSAATRLSTVPRAAEVRGLLDMAAAKVREIFTPRLRAANNPSPRLGPTINANRPIVAGFASRKGGVGKTTHAAATAATVGESLDGMPDTAALVDGNITNPDSWALNPSLESATVRTLVSRLTLGLDPPAEEYARTPRLAIYPESRTSEEMYTQAEIDVVAEYLRRRHSFVAVDLPNALPSLTGGGAGAVAAAWLTHCDVIVLPFNADPRARQGLLEYVDVLQDDEDLAKVPVVAPYILSANRAISSDPAVQRDIAELRRRGVEVVDVPDDENALLALLQDLPINRASPGLRRAYVELTECVVAAVIAARRLK